METSVSNSEDRTINWGYQENINLVAEEALHHRILKMLSSYKKMWAPARLG